MTQYKIKYVIFCCVFELTSWDVYFIVTLTLYLVPERHQPKACSRNIWAETLQCTMQKTSAYLSKSNYEKSENCNPTFRRDNFFPSSPNIDKSVSTQRFSQKREKISLSYPKLGIKVFVELWEIIHLKVWTYFSIRQMKLF